MTMTESSFTALKISSPTGHLPAVTLACAVIATLLFAYWPSVSTMIHLWNTSDTYAHGWLIPPISLYLLYQMRTTLAALDSRPAWWALLPIVAGGALWMLAYLADVQVIQQLMVVALILGITLLIAGWEWFKRAAFPLGFLFLAVPLGDGLTPHLVDMTADFVVYALRASDIPVYREGNFFVIPSGSWSVVSGCSGMRYLMATLTVGVLFAYLNYRSLWRRITFVGIAILVAIFANWLRAYGIVMIAHLSDMKLALGVDHYVYGWVFFGVVIFLLMSIGMIWSEAPAPAENEPPRMNRNPGIVTSRASLFGAVLAGLIALHLWPLLAKEASAGVSHAPLQIAADATLLAANWTPTVPPELQWQPHFVGAPTIYERAFKAGEHTVAMYVVWYAQQSQGEELINAANELVRDKYEPWRFLSASTQPTSVPAISPVLETILKQRGGERQILVWQSQWVAGHFTMSKLATKLLEIKGRLSGQGNPAAAVIFYTPMALDETPGDARKRLTQLLQGATPVLQAAFTSAAQ